MSGPETPIKRENLAAQTWDQKKRIVEAQHGILLTEAADQALASLLEHSRGDADATRLLEEHRDLLARCRRDGIETAFAGYLLPDSLQDLLAESERLTRPNEMPRKVEVYRAALRLLNRDIEPQRWGNLQNLLANSLIENPLGDRADNLEQAIFHYEQALAVYTREAFPKQWVAIQNNLATAYRNHIRGERADNLERAISYHQQALTVRTREAFPQDWAMTQLNLAYAYLYRIRGERADNLERAISYHQQALAVYTQEAFPEQWAAAQLSLAIAHRNRIRGERADNLEQAIHCSQQALAVFTREAFPERWAMAQNSLADAYSNRIRGERAENLQQAISYYEQAFEVFTPMAFPQNCRDTAYRQGCLLYSTRRFAEALHALVTAHHAVEALRGEIQREVAKRALAQENADLYARLVSCCLHEGDEGAAFQYAVAGKGRAFIDLLATGHLDLSALGATNPDLANDLHTARVLRQQIDNLLALLTDGSGQAPFPPDILRVPLRVLQTQEASHWEDMAYKYPALTATEKAPVLTADQAPALAAELNATLVEYYRHAEGWCAFVVTPQTLRHVPLPLIDDTLLARMVSWVQQIESSTGIGRNQLSLLPLSEWHTAVIAPLQRYLSREQPIVLSPFGRLHLLPLTAARNPDSGHYLAEDYLIAFTPSLTALLTMRNRVHLPSNDGQGILGRLLNVAYPGEQGSPYYLPNILREAQAIAEYFAQVTPLYEDVATPDEVVKHSRDQDVIHFGCHGWFDLEQPEQSGLLLAGGWLTVQRIITELQLNQARLAMLGACRSGRAALQSGDEYIGLMQSMLTSGVQTVVASLWKVDDDATQAVFAAFYAWLAAGRTPASALQEAARAVREDPRHPSWRHPYYWAAFQVSGLAHASPY